MGKNTHNLALANKTYEQESQPLRKIPETPAIEENSQPDFSRQRSRAEYQGMNEKLQK